MTTSTELEETSEPSTTELSTPSEKVYVSTTVQHDTTLIDNKVTSQKDIGVETTAVSIELEEDEPSTTELSTAPEKVHVSTKAKLDTTEIEERLTSQKDIVIETITHPVVTEEKTLTSLANEVSVTTQTSMITEEVMSTIHAKSNTHSTSMVIEDVTETVTDKMSGQTQPDGRSSVTESNVADMHTTETVTSKRRNDIVLIQWLKMTLTKYTNSMIDVFASQLGFGTTYTSCVKASCLNGGTCLEKADSYFCLCPHGFTGDSCEKNSHKEIWSLCSFNPCRHGGICISNNKDEYHCECQGNYQGQVCEKSIDPCSSSPCANGGTCIESDGQYTCQCDNEHFGTSCQLPRPVQCDLNSCKHGGTCSVDDHGGILCSCPDGYEGAHCEIDAQLCQSSPCLNGGTCIDDTPFSFSCECTNGFSGETCEHTTDTCLINNCLNGGSCVEHGSFDFKCSCLPGFTGSKCENAHPCLSTPCHNDGECIENADGDFTCICSDDFTGDRCHQVQRMPCETNRCYNGGSCMMLNDSAECLCHSGFNGPLCEDSEIYTDCMGANCTAAEHCAEDDVECMKVWASVDVACTLSPCNDGKCVVYGPDYSMSKCLCARSETGPHCEKTVDSCDSGVCGEHGTCKSVTGILKYICICDENYVGTNCSVVSACASEPCANGGACRSTSSSYLCRCQPGFSGNNCQMNTRDQPCLSGPCANGGVCIAANGQYSCICSKEYTGKNCNTAVSIAPPCAKNPCKHNGVCVPGEANYTCQCSPMFTGRNCETSIDRKHCKSSICNNHGTCLQNALGYLCICEKGYTGIDCKNLMERPCHSSPCENGGKCSQNDYKSYKCECNNNFWGQRCEHKNMCSNNPCKNGATCSPKEDGNLYKCTCITGYAGVHCESSKLSLPPFKTAYSMSMNSLRKVRSASQSMPCSVGTCVNGGLCLERPSGSKCVCPVGYHGTTCSNVTSVSYCANDTCLNGGICQETEHMDTTCVCPVVYSGPNCGNFTNPCHAKPCDQHQRCRALLHHLTNGYFCFDRRRSANVKRKHKSGQNDVLTNAKPNRPDSSHHSSVHPQTPKHY